MERIPEDKYFKYNADTLVYMRKLYNLDKPGQMDEAIDLLDAWIKKQSHFVRKDYPREYLERVIMLLKGSVERAKGQIDKICTIRTLLPEYFEKLDVKKDFKLADNHHTSAFLSRLTEEHYRVYIVRFEAEKFTPKILLHFYYHLVIVNEYLKAHDFSNSLISVLDFRRINSIIEFMAQLNVNDFKHICTIFLNGYSSRVAKFIIISNSNAIELFVKLMRQILSEKLSKRIYVVRDDEGFHEHVSKALLPSDYGGEEKSNLAELRDKFYDAMASKENIEHLKQMHKARTNESMRISAMDSELSGVAGTFRTLSVD